MAHTYMYLTIHTFNAVCGYHICTPSDLVLKHWWGTALFVCVRQSTWMLCHCIIFGKLKVLVFLFFHCNLALLVFIISSDTCVLLISLIPRPCGRGKSGLVFSACIFVALFCELTVKDFVNSHLSTMEWICQPRIRTACEVDREN